jgi:hypothetical protein
MRNYMHFFAPHKYNLLILIEGKVISKEVAEIKS